MDDKSWIKLFRKTLDNPIVTKDADHLAIWVFLLLSASHKEKDIVFNKERITLQRGQLITGTISISKKLKINQTKVQRILKFFENEKQIDQQMTNKNRLISIVNWELYQKNDYQNDYQVTNNRLTSDYQVTTNKNIKNVRNNIEERNNSACAREEENKKTEIFDYDWIDDSES